MDFNVAVKKNLQPTDISIIYGDEPVIFTEAVTITDLVVELGLYKSKSQARNAGRVGLLPTGYNEIKASKISRVYLWNPSE